MERYERIFKHDDASFHFFVEFDVLICQVYIVHIDLTMWHSSQHNARMTTLQQFFETEEFQFLVNNVRF